MPRRSLPALSIAFSTFVSLTALVGCGSAAALAPPPVTLPSPCPSVPPPPAASSAPSPADSAGAAAGTTLGQIDFPITGSDECKRHFREGMLALHSFLYDQAHVSFGAALAADPKCAMAAWGDAMAYDKALWYERDLAKGRAALARVSGEDALTPKERAYLGAARALYEKESIDDGQKAWLAGAAAMHHDYPDDDEVTLQNALALLSVYAEDSAHVREQMEAGALALQVFARSPQHPGAAHYVIHAFDSSDHAILALPAARTYARIAPAASHALHMPSHVFTHLGMWRDVVPSNERAYAASVAWEKSRGHTPSEYDWHSYSWLVAAHLELGQRVAARKLIDDARALLVAAKDDSESIRGNYVSMVANYATQTGKWDDFEAMIAPALAPAFDEGQGGGGGGHVACAAHAPGGTGETRLPSVLFARLQADSDRAEAAIRHRDEGAVAKRIEDMKAVRAQTGPWQKMMPPDFATRWDARAAMLLARAHAAAKPSVDTQKKATEAIERYARLVAASSTSGPAMRETTREILAEALVTAGKPKEALAQLEADLAERPNRAVALLGAARAAKASGDPAKARARYVALADLWKDADPDLPELEEVRAGAQ